MKGIILVLVLTILTNQANAQSSTVRADELSLSVEVDERDHPPFTNEMVLITVRGLYRRHITRETLKQPDFDGFSWSQLGPDKWTEERIDGKKVKTFERRMAVYPNRPGRLTIDAFTHALTLTDEGDDWFDHAITSNSVTIDVVEAPPVDGWWFPVRSLRVSDEWSNAPALLKPGEGVLRVVRLEALGATPEMIPPMPEMTSPSAMIFPHPEKRLVELSPAGPITYAFWRWTIRPTNDTSAIVEPLTFAYYDTTTRTHQSVTISAQRVAYGDIVPEETSVEVAATTEARLPGPVAGLSAMVVFIVGLVVSIWGRSFDKLAFMRRFPRFDPLANSVLEAARRSDIAGIRRGVSALIARDGVEHFPHRRSSLRDLDAIVFSPRDAGMDLRSFARAFVNGSR